MSDITFKNHKTNISTINKQLYPYNLTIKNDSNESLYWLKTSYQDQYCMIPEQRLSNLGAKQEQNLTLNLSCSLSTKNPKPLKDHKINLIFKTATNSKFELPLTVSINYADINISKAEISKDGKNLNIKIQNIGTENLVNAKVKLLKPFNTDIQELTLLETNASKLFVYPLPIDKNGKTLELEENATVSLEVFIPNTKLEKENPKVEVAPISIWEFSNVSIEFGVQWYVYLYFVLGAFSILAFLFYKRYTHPLVTKLSKNSNELLNVPFEELKEAEERWAKIFQQDNFKNILSENNITQERYTQATAFTIMTPNKKAKHLNQRIFAQSTPLGTHSYMMTLKDDFPLNVKSFILFFSNKESLDDMMSDIKEIPQYRSHILFVVSDSSEKQLGLYEQGAKHEKIVLPHPKEMTRLLLESDGSKVLADIFASQLALTQISPYQLGGGVKSSMFFGRAEIVSHILGRDNSNYIVIGSRQIGKSSLLKAIEREYRKSHEEVYYVSLNAGDLVKGMAKALGLKAKTLDEVVNFLLQESKPYLFLIDEADKFVQYEKAQGYEILNALRKLSEEGKVNFILAGFWELYQYTVLDYQSPLKNFGETIELGALEQEACEEMMREPMKQLGLTIEQEAIESIIDQVGQRANLIAIICHNIIKNLGKTKKKITLKDAKEAMKEKNAFELFESWRELNDDERANRLDRIIVYATVKEGNFTLKSLLDSLKERGLSVDILEIEKSLDRLKVSYTIERNSEGVYVYRVALFREYVLQGDYEVKLEGEIERFVY